MPLAFTVLLERLIKTKVLENEHKKNIPQILPSDMRMVILNFTCLLLKCFHIVNIAHNFSEPAGMMDSSISQLSVSKMTIASIKFSFNG